MDESGEPQFTDFEENQENSNEGKLQFKLKSSEIEERNPIEVISDDELHVCKFCNRGFSSGKALGGHMRVHVQENKGDIIKIGKNPKINHNSIEKSQHLDSLSKNPICSLCGKGFPSLKSLCGHMRCHPEREYRGIQPPKIGSSYPSSSSSVSDEIESTNPTFLSWSVKDKRGRVSLVPSATSSPSNEYGLSEEEKEVVLDLMMLAQGESFHLDLPSKHKIEAKNSNQINIGPEIGYKDRIFELKKQNFEDLINGSGCKRTIFNKTVPFEKVIERKDQVFESKRRKNEDLGYGSKCKNLKINEKRALEAKDSSSDNEFGVNLMDDNVSTDLIVANMSSKKKRSLKKNPKFRDLESIENEGEDDKNENNRVVEKEPIVEYKCITCNKCFSSHQALGGHRSSHNKFKNTNQDQDIGLVPPLKFDHSRLIIQGDDMKNTNIINPSNVLHQCKICNKIFPTGQALGGHQRCHWAGPTQGPVSSQEAGPSSHATSSSGVQGFDLNEMPLMDEDDSGVESYNDANELVLYGYGS